MSDWLDEDPADAAGEPLGVDGNGVPTELLSVGGFDVIVHHDDLPESDVTILHGIPCTTAVRTVIDIAVDVEGDHLDTIIEDCLQRGLFTLDEARRRVAQADMAMHPGAALVRARLLRLP